MDEKQTAGKRFSSTDIWQYSVGVSFFLHSQEQFYHTEMSQTSQAHHQIYIAWGMWQHKWGTQRKWINTHASATGVSPQGSQKLFRKPDHCGESWQHPAWAISDANPLVANQTQVANAKTRCGALLERLFSLPNKKHQIHKIISRKRE